MTSMALWWLLLMRFLQEAYVPAYQQLRDEVAWLAHTYLEVEDEPVRAYGHVVAFYAQEDRGLVWHGDRLEQWLRVIGESGWEGLRPDDYHYQTVQQLARQPVRTPEEQAHLDLLASDGMLLLLYHITSGKVNPEMIDPNCHLDIETGQPVAHLERALGANNLYLALDSVRPKWPDYYRLLYELRHLHFRSDWPAWEMQGVLYPDTVHPHIPRLRQILIATGDFSGDTSSWVYDDQLQAGVHRFQQRHGLIIDGIIGQSTQAMLHKSRQERIQTVMVNLERWRWLPAMFSDYYVIVNIADFVLYIVKEGQVVARHDVIVGKPARKTPIFSARMRFVEFNPTWTIPPTIKLEDVLPAVRKDVQYLSSRNIAAYNQKMEKVDPLLQDWNDPSVRHFRFVQDPGPNNALGQIKFMFPNPYLIYMHDTPNRDLFERSTRTFSSGCIRVCEPLAMAEVVLAHLGWDSTSIQAAVDSANTHTVRLREQPDVHIMYFTSWMGSTGQVQYRKDVYALDEPIYEALIAPMTVY